MSQTRRLSLLAGAVLGTTGVASAETGQAWNNSDEVRALVSEMMSDAETRSSLLQSGGTAGHDGKFFLASSDGNFRLNVGGQIQFRYYMNFRDDGDGDTDGNVEDDFESGFQTRRTKLEFSGHVHDPNLFYKVVGAYSSSDGNMSLEDAYVGYRWDNGFSAMWGQFKLPYMREELVSSKYQLAVERSVINETFNQDWAQGIQLSYDAEDWRFAAAFSDGFGSRNSEFGSVANFSTFGANNVNGNTGGGEADWAITGRGEFKFAGTWENFKDFTSAAGEDFAFLLGVAGHIEQSANTNAVPFDTTYYALTGDISLEGDGWNIFVAANGSWASNETSDAAVGGTNTDFADYGVVAQGGFLIPDTNWEPFLRYDIMFIDDDRVLDGADDNVSFLTFGVNNYIYGHAAKFTADCVWALNSVGDNVFGTTGPSMGILGDDDENEITLRFQFQLLF